MGVSVPNLPPWSWTKELLQMSGASTNMVATVISGTWALWTGRNGRRNGRKLWEPGSAARYISKLMEDLSSLRRRPSHVRQREKQHWTRPESGVGQGEYCAGFDISLTAQVQVGWSSGIMPD